MWPSQRRLRTALKTSTPARRPLQGNHYPHSSEELNCFCCVFVGYFHGDVWSIPGDGVSLPGDDGVSLVGQELVQELVVEQEEGQEEVVVVEQEEVVVVEQEEGHQRFRGTCPKQDRICHS